MTPQKNALDALAFVCRTLGWLEVVPPYGDAVSRTAECDKAIKLCGEIRAALQAAQVPAEYRIADQSMAEAYQELFGMLCELKSPPLHSEMNDIINLVLKHWRNK